MIMLYKLIFHVLQAGVPSTDAIKILNKSESQKGPLCVIWGQLFQHLPTPLSQINSVSLNLNKPMLKCNCLLGVL